jgi:hypothetical protein
MNPLGQPLGATNSYQVDGWRRIRFQVRSLILGLFGGSSTEGRKGQRADTATHYIEHGAHIDSSTFVVLSDVQTF